MDVWTIEHLFSGISIGYWVILFNVKLLGVGVDRKMQLYIELINILMIAFFWETLEHYLELGLAGEQVAYWFQGEEFWMNRLIFDPLMLIIGYLLAKRFTMLILPARLLSLAWLAIHIFIFPHSMYLHQIY